MAQKFTNKVVLVTGGSSGLGRGMAQEFAKQGAQVVITGRHEDTLKAVANSYQDSISYVVSDLTKHEDVKKIGQFIQEKFNHLDVLVNNAGWCPNQPIQKMSLADYDAAFNLDVRGLVDVTIETLPMIIKAKGDIINLSSIGCHNPKPGLSLYTGAKNAIEDFTKVWAQDLAADDVRVNAIAPGAFDTNIWNQPGQSEEEKQAAIKVFTDTIPMKRMGQPQEIGKLAAFLASDDADYITGAIYNIGGGMQ